MGKYESPIMEVMNFKDSIGTGDIVIDSVIEKGDNNQEVTLPGGF